jgi:hypothetical protein
MAQTIYVIGGNLWQIAAQQMGDPLQAPQIALTNNLTDYFLPQGAPFPLLIPDPIDPSLSTGLPTP